MTNKYSHLTDDGGEVNKAKNTKKCVIKRKIKFEAAQLEEKLT